MATTDTTPERDSYKAAAWIGLATLISRVLGLVREQVFAYLFGAGFYADAFQMAFRIPNLLRNLLAEGSMSAALVPVYAKARSESEERGWALANNALHVLGVVASALMAAGVIFADPIVRLYAPGFLQISGKHELTVTLSRLLWPFLPVMVAAAITMGILNARQSFKVPAFASCFFNLSTILVALVLCPLLPRFFGLPAIYGMAVAVLIGGVLQWLMQLPALRREGWSYGFAFSLKDPELRRMVVLMGAGTFGLAATQINILVNSILASSQGEGAVSWLNYAFRLMQFPIGVFGIAISTVALSRVSRHVVAQDWSAVQQTILQGLRLVLVLTIPSAVGLALLGIPLISVIYEHGHFHENDTIASALALAAYSLGLSAYSGVKVLGPIFYSLGRARVTVGASLLAVAASTSLGILLVGRLGFGALALGTSVGALCNFLILLVVLGRVAPKFPWGELRSCFLRVLLASLFMGLLLWLISLILGISPLTAVKGDGLWAAAGNAERILFLSTSLVVGVASYGLCARLMGLKEIDTLLEIFRQKLRSVF